VVVIKSIAREAGSRTKIAVMSTKQEIDPIGACVGQRGTRVQAVINELGGEKIDIILFDESPAKYISHALSPGKVSEVKIVDDKRLEAQAFVPEDQLSLTIGKEGQNVRLAAKLTGWRIDIVRDSAAVNVADQKAKDDQEVTDQDVVVEIVESEKAVVAGEPDQALDKSVEPIELVVATEPKGKEKGKKKKSTKKTIKKGGIK